MESIILIGMHGWYIVRVMRFNRATLPPDAYRGLSESLSSVSAICMNISSPQVMNLEVKAHDKFD